MANNPESTPDTSTDPVPIIEEEVVIFYPGQEIEETTLEDLTPGDFL